MIYYCYTLNPIDWWHSFLEPEVYLEQVRIEVEEFPCAGEGVEEEAFAWLEEMREVVKAAKYFEGPVIKEGIGAMPGNDYSDLRIYIAKQPRQGTCFCVSEVPLWHLHKPDPVEVNIVETVEASAA